MLTDLAASFSALPAGNLTPTPMVDLRAAAEAAARRSFVHLKTRMQDIAIEGDARLKACVADHGAMVRLFSNAIREISGLSLRRTSLNLTLATYQLTIKGRNPLDLPDGALAIDRKLAFLTSRLSITPVLSWDQGIGPVLTLAMPDSGAPLIADASAWSARQWPISTSPWSAQVSFQKNA